MSTWSPRKRLQPYRRKERSPLGAEVKKSTADGEHIVFSLHGGFIPENQLRRLKECRPVCVSFDIAYALIIRVQRDFESSVSSLTAVEEGGSNAGGSYC